MLSLLVVILMYYKLSGLFMLRRVSWLYFDDCWYNYWLVVIGFFYLFVDCVVYFLSDLDWIGDVGGY